MKQSTIDDFRETVPFLMAVGGAAIILLVTLLLPLGFDNDLYESMGWALYAYHGLPYLGSWDHNFPGIVYVHWASIALFGASDFGFRLFDYFVHIAMAGFFYRALRNWLSQKESLLAVIIFVLYYASGQWGLAGQRDTYAAFLLLGAVWAFVQLRSKPTSAGLLAMTIGVLCGAAFLMRPTYVFFALSFLILIWSLLNRIRLSGFFLLGCILPIVAFLFPYLFVRDGLLQVYDTIIRFNLDVYSAVKIPINLWSRGRAPIYIFAIVGILFALRKGPGSNDWRDRIMLLLLAGSALISPIMMGKYFTYHFEPFLLLVIPFAAVGLSEILQFMPTAWAKGAAVLLLLGLFVYCYYPRHLIKYYYDAVGTADSPLEVTYEHVLSDSLYGLEAQREVIQYVDRVATPEDIVETVSIFPGLRWRLHRKPPTRFTSVVPLAAYSSKVPSYAAMWRKEYITSLATPPPRLIIVSRSNQWWPFVGKRNDSAIACIPGFDSLLSANYVPDTVIRGFALYRSRK